MILEFLIVIALATDPVRIPGTTLIRANGVARVVHDFDVVVRNEFPRIEAGSPSELLSTRRIYFSAVDEDVRTAVSESGLGWEVAESANVADTWVIIDGSLACGDGPSTYYFAAGEVFRIKTGGIRRILVSATHDDAPHCRVPAECRSIAPDAPLSEQCKKAYKRAHLDFVYRVLDAAIASRDSQSRLK